MFEQVEVNYSVVRNEVSRVPDLLRWLRASPVDVIMCLRNRLRLGWSPFGGGLILALLVRLALALALCFTINLKNLCWHLKGKVLISC